MYQALRGALVALLTATLFGCAPPSHILLKPETSERIQATRTRIVVPQEELNVVVPQSGVAAAGGGGLLLALIDVVVEANRVSHATRLIEPHRKQLADFDFRAELEKKLRPTLMGLAWLKVGEIEITGQRDSNKEDLARVRAAIPQDSFLDMNVEYKLSADFRHFQVFTVAKLWQRGHEEAQYWGSYNYQSAVIGPQKDEEAANRWSANNAVLLRAALREGIDETVRMMRLDLAKRPQQGEPAPLGPDGDIEVPYPSFSGSIKLSRLATEILVKHNDRIVFRAQYSGHLHSIPTQKFFTAPTAEARPLSSLAVGVNP